MNMKTRKRLRGKWADFNASVVASFIGISSELCKKELYKEKKRLDRELTREDIGVFISEQITKKEYRNLRKFLTISSH